MSEYQRIPAHTIDAIRILASLAGDDTEDSACDEIARITSRPDWSEDPLACLVPAHDLLWVAHEDCKDKAAKRAILSAARAVAKALDILGAPAADPAVGRGCPF